MRIGAGLARDRRARARRASRAALATARGLRALLPRPAGSSRDVDAVATSAIRDATQRRGVPARARARRAADPRAQHARRRRATATSPRSTRRRWPTAPCSTSAAARCSSSASPTATRASCGSWPLGAVRMTERFLPRRRPASKKQLQRACATTSPRELEDAPWLRGAPGARLVGIGGTVRNLAAAAQRAPGCRRFGVQGFVIDARRARRAGRARSPRCRRPSARSVPGIKPARADLILAGAVVVQAVLERGGFDGRRGDRGRPARGRLLRAPPRRRPAAVRRRAPRERAQPRRASTTSTPPTPSTSRRSRSALFDELAAAGPAPRRPARARAAVGRVRCCTTSA